MAKVVSRKYKILREILRDLREGFEISQQELADKLGRPQSFVSKYERGERRLDVIEFLEVADALGIKPAKIIKQIHALRK